VRGSFKPRRRGLVALGAAVAALAFASAAPVASAQIPRSFYGVIPINNLSVSEVNKLGAANVGTLRQLVLWPQIEPQPDSYDWSYLDHLVGNAARNGIEILPFLYGTPDWAGVKCGKLDKDRCQRVPPLKPKSAKAAWSDFLGDFYLRYGPQGTFWTENPSIPFVPITRAQCWNEPSSQTYWEPRPQPRGYARLLKLCNKAIAAVDPSVKIVTAGLFPSPELGKEFRFVNYLEELFDVRGVGRQFDEAAFHPYARTLVRLKNQIKTMRKEMRQGGVGKKPLWVSELGWGSAPPVDNRPLIKGLEGQKTLLEQSFQMLSDSRGRWKLAGVIWYSFRDPGVDYANCPFCSSSGLLEGNGEAKPAWFSFLRFTGGTDVPLSP
jgi:hypothetical protein